MAEVFTKYIIDTTQAEASLNGMKQEVRELQGAENSSQKTFQTNAQKRTQLLKEEQQDLIELRKRRDAAYTTKEISLYNKRIAETEKRVKNLKGEYGQLENKNKSLVSSFKQIGLAIGVAFGVREIVNFAKRAAELSAEAEGIRTAFERVGGTAALLDNLTTATRGTVDQVQLMRQSVRASNFKIPLEQLATFFEFATTRAIETGESVDYLVNSIIDGIGRKSTLVMDNLGISATELQAEIAKVGDFGEASANIIARELGKAGDVADTTATKIERSQAELKNAMVEMGDVVAPILADVQQGLAGLVRFLVDNKEAFGALALAVGTYTAATQLAKISTEGFAKAFRLSPWGLAAAAISLATLAIVKWRSNVADANSTARLLSDTQDELNQKFAEERAQLDVLVNRIKDSADGTKQRKDAVAELNKNYGDLIGHTIDEKNALEQLDAAYQDIIRSMRERIAQQVLQGRQTEILTKQINTQLGAIEDLRDELPNAVDDWGFAINNLSEIMASSGVRNFGAEISETDERIVQAREAIKEYGNELVTVNGRTAPLISQLHALKTAYNQGNKELFLLNQLIDQYVDGQDKGNKTAGEGAAIGRTLADIQEDIKNAQERLNTEVAVGTAEYYQARAALDALNQELERWTKNTEKQLTLLEELEKMGGGIKPTDGMEEFAAFWRDFFSEFEDREMPFEFEQLEEMDQMLDDLSVEDKIESITRSIERLKARGADPDLVADLEASLDKLKNKSRETSEEIDSFVQGLLEKFVFTTEELMVAAQEAAIARLDELLEAGKITQAEYQAILNGMAGQLEAFRADQTASGIGAASQIIDAVRMVYSATSKDAAKNAGFLEALTTFQILLEGARAVASAIRAAAEGAKDPISLVIGIIAAVATVIASIARAKSMANQANRPQPPTFAYGGEIQGKPHTQGGVHINAEKGEYIVKSSAYAKAKEAVHAINSERFDTYVTKHYIEPLLKSKQLAREDHDRGFARNIAESLHLDGKAEHYLKQIARKGNGARIENWDELARLIKKDGRGSTY